MLVRAKQHLRHFSKSNMDIEKLNKEQFAALKELSQVQLDISKARAGLSALKEGTAEYLAQREKQAENVIKDVFEKSANIIKEIGKNYEEISQLHRESSDIVTQVTGFAQGIATLSERFSGYMQIERKKIDARTVELSEMEQSLKNERKNIREEYANIENIKKELETKETQLADQRATLERALNRVKK